MMIIREWRGRAASDNADAYRAHFRANVVPELRDVAGFLGADLICRQAGEQLEFVVLSRWQSMDAIHAFAGDDPQQAVVEPGAVAALSDYDLCVRHYESVETVAAAL